MSRLKTYLYLSWRFRVIAAMKLMEHRADFWFWSFVSVMWTAFNFFFFALLVNVRGDIAGWTPGEMYLLLGVFTIFDSIIWTLFYHNMQHYTSDVFSGELNHLLLKPIDTQFMLMTKDNNFTNLLRFFTGIGIVIWSIFNLGLQPSIGQLLLFVVMVLVMLLFIYFFWFTLSTIAFWVDKIDNINEVIPNIRRTFQVPHQVYTGFISIILTVIFPFALVSSVPSEILLGRGQVPLMVYMTLFTALVVVFSRWFFNYSVKKFSGIAN